MSGIEAASLMGTTPMNRGRWMLVCLLLVLPSASVHAQQRYAASGLVLSVDRSRQTMVVSCQEISGFMDAMVMSFSVPEAKSLDPLTRGALIEFTLIVNKDASHAENVRVLHYDSAEREPSKARRLQSFDEALRGPLHPLAVGQAVPDFTLTDQQKRAIHFRQFAGKVVALNFVYTRCALPEYCFRSSNNFGVLQKRFQDRLGKDLILLTVTFDPVRDQPEVLRNYAKTWKADPENWRFLTGPAPDVQRVCDWFGVNFVPDEGLFVHSLHTVIVARDGKLVANLEGNEFTAQQFADLLETVLDPARN
jgi:protein SCO1/2